MENYAPNRCPHGQRVNSVHYDLGYCLMPEMRQKHQLAQLLQLHFRPDEFYALCAELDVDHENLPGVVFAEHLEHFIEYIVHRGRLLDLADLADEIRPKANWYRNIGVRGTPDQMPLDDVPPPGRLPLGSRIPYGPNPYFVGRQAQLKQLATWMQQADPVAINQAIAATGMGGIGNSQLAIAFAYRYGAYFPGGVFWLSLADPANAPRRNRRLWWL